MQALGVKKTAEECENKWRDLRNRKKDVIGEHIAEKKQTGLLESKI